MENPIASTTFDQRAPYEILRNKLMRELLDAMTVANHPQFVVQPGEAIMQSYDPNTEKVVVKRISAAEMYQNATSIPINDTTEADRRNQQIEELTKHIESMKGANPWVVAGSGGLQQVGTATMGNVSIAPGGISAPMASPEKPAKRMDEMTFADFQRGIDNWWPHRNRG